VTRNRPTYRLLIGLGLCAAMVACDAESPPLQSVDMTAAAISGTLRDLAGDPVAGALIEVGDLTAVTDADGRFEITEVAQDVPVQVLARAPGYSTGHLSVEVPGRTVRHVDLRVVPSVEHTISAADGGRIERADGVVIDLPAGAYVDADGAPVGGEITVTTATWRTEHSLVAAQGGMEALIEGERVALESFGMVQVELSSDGEPVELDGVARIELPLAHSARFVEGEKVGLWHFDEGPGAWSLDGEGEIFGHTFVAEVTHFSTWNCDRPRETTCLTGRLLAPSGDPIDGGQVVTVGLDYSGSDTTWTATDGTFRSLARIGSDVSVASAGFLEGTLDGQFAFGLQAHTPTTLADEGPCLDLGTIVVSDITVDDDGDGMTELEGDCDDADITVYRGAEEICNWVDEDCNGIIEQGPDADFDGEGSCLDCNEEDWSVHTRAPDVCDGTADNNCDGATDDREADLDADGMSYCEGDCDDSNPSVSDGCAWRSLSAGNGFTCGVRPMGDIVCWGNLRAELGSVPVGPYTEVAAGDDFACGLLQADGVTCWTDDSTWMPGNLATARASLTSGATHRCALDVDGRVSCDGADDFGQSTSPPGLFVELAAGALHTCALGETGEVTCWGSNAAEQAAAPEGVWDNLVAGSIHTCASGEDGATVCWGDDGFGQLHVPEGLLLNDLSAGAQHTCGITSRGTAECWGSNEFGQSAPPPGALRGLASGASHTCALDARGQAVCWGDDSLGQSTVPN